MLPNYCKPNQRTVSVIRENNGNGFRRVWEKSSGRDETKYVRES
jgi:hypothetical protein